MNDHNSISLYALVYCLLTGKDHISDAAIDDDLAFFEGADRIMPGIVDAAIKRHIIGYGIPTQTRFPFPKSLFEDMPDRAVKKAISCLNRGHDLPVSDELRYETHLSERYLDSGHEEVPADIWRIDAVAWSVSQLLIWNSKELDLRFQDSEVPPWVENPYVEPQVGSNEDTADNPFAVLLPQYDPFCISGYSSLRFAATAVEVCRSTCSVAPKRDDAGVSSTRAAKSEMLKPGRKSKTDWNSINVQVREILSEGDSRWTWKALLNAALKRLEESDAENVGRATVDSWKKHLSRTNIDEDKTLLAEIRDRVG